MGRTVILYDPEFVHTMGSPNVACCYVLPRCLHSSRWRMAPAAADIVAHANEVGARETIGLGMWGEGCRQKGGYDLASLVAGADGRVVPLEGIHETNKMGECLIDMLIAPDRDSRYCYSLAARPERFCTEVLEDRIVFSAAPPTPRGLPDGRVLRSPRHSRLLVRRKSLERMEGTLVHG